MAKRAGRWKFTVTSCVLLIVFHIVGSDTGSDVTTAADQSESSLHFTSNLAYLEASQNSQITIPGSLSLQRHIAFSFRTCHSGSLFHQSGASIDTWLRLQIDSDGLLTLSWSLTLPDSRVLTDTLQVGTSPDTVVTNNQWYTVDLNFQKGEIYLRLEQGARVLHSLLISNSSYNSHLWSLDLTGGSPITVGNQYTGCLQGGPGIDLLAAIDTHVVSQGTCPLDSTTSCGTEAPDPCWQYPCDNGGTCTRVGSTGYSCACPEPYSGTHCESDLGPQILGYCNLSPCQNGGECVPAENITRRYTCDCLPGYTGVNCEIEINECAPQPCENGGTCVDGVNGYTCLCQGTGFEGPRCERNVDECLTRAPCVGGATCSDTPGSYKCQCVPGFGGKDCDLPIDECSSEPCYHGATCVDLVGMFLCECVAGYTGALCQHDLDDCLGVVCPRDNAECRDLLNGYDCVCNEGFTELAGECVGAGDCRITTCQNRGECVDVSGTYKCRCTPDYTGEFCERETDACDSSPCLNKASCVAMGGATYRCDCLPGYLGDRCEIDIDSYAAERPLVVTCVDCKRDVDDCDLAPCENGGTCRPGAGGVGYTCLCTEEWMGKNCSQEYNMCAFSPCQHGANCATTPPTREYVCTCADGYTGRNCETNIDDCVGVTCPAPTECFDLVNNYTCSCPVGYEGSDCDVTNQCHSAPCQNGGSCVATVDGFTCECRGEWVNHTQYTGDSRSVYWVGYEGAQCEIDVEECSMPICLNGGICQRGDNASSTDYGFLCYCPSGQDGNQYFTGKYCHIQKDYCEIVTDLPACKNGGTCRATSNDFVCECAPGFTDPRCITNMDECLSSPCINGATCMDGAAGYTCACVPGFTGTICEVNVDECGSSPCQHGGLCLDRINGYECNCTGTGFSGDLCEVEIRECGSNPCQNGAQCTEQIQGYSCECWPGFTGTNCEVDINECASAPCENNGTCVQRSTDQTRPGYDPRYADGYDCVCLTGFSGDNCEVNIDECKSGHSCVFGRCIDAVNGYVCACEDGYMGLSCELEIDECSVFSPCRFGATCVDLMADYECQCAEYEGSLYGGKNCTVALTGCEPNACQNGGTCVPTLVSEDPEQHSSYCDCPPGFHGDVCDVNTTASFSGDSWLRYEGTDGRAELVTSFRYQTTLPNGILLLNAKETDQNPTMPNFFLLSLVGGSTLRLDYNSSAYGKRLEISLATPATLTDGVWYQVNLTIGDTLIELHLTHPACPGGLCTRTTDSGDGPTTQHHTLGETFVGGDRDDSPFAAGIPSLTACVQDLVFDGEMVIPGDYTAPELSQNLGVGCPRVDQCGPDPCLSHGDCTDLWLNYTCQCWRPYFGDNCAEGYTPGTFGNGVDTSSLAMFTIPSDSEYTKELENNNDISLFFRSSKEEGLMFYLGNRADTYLAVLLEGGYLRIRVKLGGAEELCDQSRIYVTNGEQYFFRLQRRFLSINYWINWVDGESDPTITEESASISCVVSDFQGILHPVYLYLGGMPASASGRRRKRELDLATVESFKGTVVDARQNGWLLELFSTNTTNSTDHLPSYPEPILENVLEGEVTDPMCELHSPCVNNATCQDIFFNDYKCMCVEGFRGKNCSELDFCVSSQCPGNATCNNLDDGYECVSSATFDGAATYVQYSNTLNHSYAIDTISVEFRTRQQSGVLVHIRGFGEFSENFITIELSRGLTLVSFDLGEAHQLNSSLSDVDLADGEWHNVSMEIMTGGVMVTVDTANVDAKLINNSVTLFELARDSEDLFVGGVSSQYLLGTPAMFHGDTAYFKGCLGEVRVGEILLPFFDPADLENNTSVEQFHAEIIEALEVGCYGDPVCDTHDCENNATCVDIWNAYECVCVPGFNGTLCDNNIDECVGNECENNATCVDGINEYSCDCVLGFMGERCETEIDECESDPCLNNATCADLVGRYECSCATNYTGVNCEIDIRENCEVNPTLCNNGTCISINTTFDDVTTFNCSCYPGFTGRYCDSEINYCEDAPCQNNATCVSSRELLNYTCSCLVGYTGVDCETEIDECAASPCQNGATCVDRVGFYECQCASGWNGTDCDLDIDECEVGMANLTQPCENGACVNLPGSYVCNCTGSGYEGDRCQSDIDECLDETTCKNGANCTNSVGDFTCNCTLGYEDKDCGVANCSHDNCMNGGTCDIQDGTWLCHCPQYIEGFRCEAPGPCLDEPCQNNATCSQSGELYTCDCQPGWEGQNCTADIDECTRYSPCDNGATCTNSPGDYSCACVPGYTDKNCTTDIDECESSPCQHGGQCDDRVNEYVCDCSGTGYNGTECETDINECLATVPLCENGGSCNNLEGSFNCSCQKEFVGDTCHSRNPCLEEYCYNGGTCDYLVDDPARNATPRCDCVDPWYGEQCEFTEYAVVKEKDNILPIVLGAVFGGIALIIIIALIVVFVVLKDKRATRGTYSPSRQETVGSRVELGNVLKQPPLERLI